MIFIKNFFFNVFVCWNFLKLNLVEMWYINDEFQWIVIVNVDIFFFLYYNGSEIFYLFGGKFWQCLIGVFGSYFNKKLVLVVEEMEVFCFNGYVGKLEFVKKIWGEQYFFVNNCYIKSNYLNYVVVLVYEELLLMGIYFFYVIFIDIDFKWIDINVYFIKQEIKFEDECLVYNYFCVFVWYVFGQYNVMLSFDFEQDLMFSQFVFIWLCLEVFMGMGNVRIGGSSLVVGYGEVFFDVGCYVSNFKYWQDVYEGLDEFDFEFEVEVMLGQEYEEFLMLESDWKEEQGSILGELVQEKKKFIQFYNSYIFM